MALLLPTGADYDYSKRSLQDVSGVSLPDSVCSNTD